MFNAARSVPVHIAPQERSRLQRTDEVRRGDSGDQAAASASHELNVIIASAVGNAPREVKDFKAVRLALNLLPECKECGEEISEKRLRAAAYTTRCTDCQERVEAENKRRHH